MPLHLKSSFKTIDTGSCTVAPKWILGIPGINVQRNYNRQFSDGVMIARAIHHYEPKLVDLHNYSSAHSKGEKKANWEILNWKVLPKLNIKLTKKQIEQLVEVKPGAVDEILSLVGQKLVYDPVTYETIGDINASNLAIKSDPPKGLIGKAKAKIQSRFSAYPVSSKDSLTPVVNQACYQLKRSDTFTVSKSSDFETVADMQTTQQAKHEEIAEKKKNMMYKWIDSITNEFAQQNYSWLEEEMEEARRGKQVCDNLVERIWGTIEKKP